jgi:hypothetical protein
MANPRLNAAQLKKAKSLLSSIRKRLLALSAGDLLLHFAYRRKIWGAISQDERGGPANNRRIKKLKWKKQKGKCAFSFCRKELSETGSELHRIKAADGYTEENTQLVHRLCHLKQQKKERYG